ncbi:MAG TPA: S-layer homology domain-containing protein [Bacillota bacterium]|nr:S-layer homology domain-containing protein [Bacillota bacterium]HQI15946.1 S-layer homology domain-containing protein [Bacillota bacterium]HQJ37878.1 S-layer homology domain-containing protein [Bacillota bacterium]HRS20503.1 S-layer homology domain-containing protein [Clostridia bacterium]HRU41983.1 S-layer homology domain-containing protein [Candidatus Diapherotrites archaeon]
MNKRILSIVLSLCLILTMIMNIPVFAAGGVTVNKSEYTVKEKGNATITGLSDQEIEDGAYLGISAEGERLSNTPVDVYISDLPADNVWEFEAPFQLGKFELRLMDYEGNLIAKTAFSVAAPKAKPGDIAVSKAEVKIKEPMYVKIGGLTEEQIEEGAWLAISKNGEKIENTSVDKYISDLPADNTYRFEAPYKFGKYEVRVFSDSNAEPVNSFFGMTEFLVVSSKAQPGDIVISKSPVLPEEKMSVTVKGLTPGELTEGAWLGITRSDERLENTYVSAYIQDLPVSNTYEFNAPSEPGTYEVRVFCSSTMEPEEFEYGKFGTAQFIVSGEAAPSDDIEAGEEGLSAWAAPVVNEAKDQNLVTDKVLVDFPSPITREEFCELAVLLYEKMTGTEAPLPAANPFNDTTNPKILKAANLGIVGGVGGGKFAPNNNVTRQEIAVMLLRTLKNVMPNISTAAEFKTQFQDVSSIDSWALEAVKFMNANDIIGGSTVNGVSYMLPKGNTTREQAIALVLRMYNTFNKL